MRAGRGAAVWFAAALLAAAVILWWGRRLPWDQRAALAASGLAAVLWVFEPVPLTASSLYILIALVVLHPITVAQALTGFASQSMFLLIGGLMMAQGVQESGFGERAGLYLVSLFGGGVRGMILGLLVAGQVLAFFVPATSVRATLLLPAVAAMVAVMDRPGAGLDLRKGLYLAVAFAGSISGAGLLPASAANPIVASFLKPVLGHEIDYFEWLKFNLPVSLLMIPVVWWGLTRSFLRVEAGGDEGRAAVVARLRQLGPLRPVEWRTAAILSATCLLWLTQAWTHIPTFLPALVAPALMVAPGLQIVSWDRLRSINVGTLLIFGASLGLGAALHETGAADVLAGFLTRIPGVAAGLQIPFLNLVLVALLMEIAHLGFAGVPSVTVTVMPIAMALAARAGQSVFAFGLTAGLAALFGYVLVVETMPMIVVYGTGAFEQTDLRRAGLPISGLSLVVLGVVGLLWWPLVMPR